MLNPCWSYLHLQCLHSTWQVPSSRETVVELIELKRDGTLNDHLIEWFQTGGPQAGFSQHHLKSNVKQLSSFLKGEIPHRNEPYFLTSLQ